MNASLSLKYLRINFNGSLVLSCGFRIALMDQWFIRMRNIIVELFRGV